MKPGDTVLLQENDRFGTQSVVVILKIHKGGNCIVQDGDHERETHLNKLKPYEPMEQ